MRASYARYYQQLSFADVGRENPTRASFLAYGWTDANGDRFVQPGEVNLNSVRYLGRRQPGESRLGLGRYRQQDRPRPAAPQDDEFVVGLDRELGLSFAAGVAITYRQPERLVECHVSLEGRVQPTRSRPTEDSCPLMAASDYTRNAPVTANGYTGFSYSPIAALVTAGRGGRLLTNRKGYSTSLHGPGADAQQAPVQQVDGSRGVQPRGLDANVEHAVGANGNRPRGTAGTATTSWTPTRWLSRAAPWGRARTSWAARSGSSTATRSTSSRGAWTSRVRSGAGKAA